MRKIVMIYRKIKGTETPVLMDKIKLDIKSKKHTNFAVLEEIYNLQKEKDVLKIGEPCDVGDMNIGISRIIGKGRVETTMESAGEILYTGRNSYEMGGTQKIKEDWQNPVTVNGKEYYYGFTWYEPGYVLSTGSENRTMFGTRYEMYLKSIGTRNVRFTSVGDAKIFQSLQIAKKYIEEHMKELSYMVEKNSYVFQLKPSCTEFEKSLEELPDKKKEENRKIMTSIQELLDQINGAEPSVDTEDIPEEYDEEIGHAEILRRMISFNLYRPVITDFVKSRKLYMSLNGIIYDLDDGAKEAVKKAEELDLVPYHVIFDTLDGMPMYTVLYLSKIPEQWADERPHNGGIIIAAVDGYGFNIGSVQVKSAHGGIVRLQ